MNAKVNKKVSANKAENGLRVKFDPSRNGQYKIAFDENNRDDGFAVLLQGGLFHRFPDGFVVTKKHIELLDKQSVKYTKIKRPK